MGEREGREWHAKTHSTREGLGRCPNGGFSLLVSLLRPTHGSSVLPAVLSPTAPIHNLPSFLSRYPHCKKNMPGSLPFTASNKDGTIEHVLEGFDTPEQVKAFLTQKYNMLSQQQGTGYISLLTYDQPGCLALHPTAMDDSEESLEKAKQGNSKKKGRGRAKERKGNSDNVLGGRALEKG